MKSICLKTNNEEAINFIIRSLEKNFDDIVISSNKFKIFNNVIVHYRGDNEKEFLIKISNLVASLIEIFYEPKILDKIIDENYFYFEDYEKEVILRICEKIIEIQESDLAYKKEILKGLVFDYFLENKIMILDGFINFRTKPYLEVLDYVVDISVNKFLIEKEYNEFIDILKLYVSMSPFNSPVVHLIYCNGESILLDNDKNIIPIKKDLLNAKYLSDITFSANDYSLNTLLNINPKKLVIHLVDKKEDEFINTLKIIFDTRVQICNECKICSLYSKIGFMSK